MLTRSLLLALLVAFGGPAAAQTKASDDLPPPVAAPGGIQGQNIFDVKPEVKPDASSDPGYLQQNNGQRNRVQPGNNAPMWRGVAAGNAGYSSLPRTQAPEAGVLIQGPVQYPGSRLTTAGEAWRQVRNNWIIPYGGALFLIMLGALAILFFARGPLGHSENSGLAAIERFTPFERSAHWANAIAFVCLAVSGLVMAFGKFFLLPVLGLTLYGGLSYVLKNLHNFAGPLFAVSLVIIFLTFVRDNLPQRGDLRWLLHFGGALRRSGDELPSHRFNAGEKVVFWAGVFLFGFVAVASGLVMDHLIPGLLYERQTMQVTHMVHSVAAVLMMCVFALHIYLGTIGLRGAYRAMRTGYVDDAWAREHHAYWYEDIDAGRVPAQRSRPRGSAGEIETARPA
ncbi:formate dehydrogenase subunit gamma [Ramlibacter sp.]|uniref:formate dehydrogenase subunit gamma n=1 Tax=Ramlibacter sp. TaxID=1917967 RepID=UPI002B8F248E|nr:formate dehydrogenase subunit gamma [Ramlibacter sp.]HWI82821.1 formate dehydrogenase subunit gamma [Ramlibacter sp.]